jgi:hypothetical protein
VGRRPYLAGKADDLSDIDIHLAVVDERCAELYAQRRAFVAEFGEPLLIQERRRTRLQWRLSTGALSGRSRAD